MITRLALFTLSASLALAPGVIVAAHAQSPIWPSRIVRLVVPFTAGGPTDIIARIVAEQLSKVWGQQVVIENRGGAGTNIGNEMVARADPDGYMALFATSSLAVNRSLYRVLSYDPVADLAPVSQVSRFALFMFVPNSLPAKCHRSSPWHCKMIWLSQAPYGNRGDAHRPRPPSQVSGRLTFNVGSLAPAKVR